MGDKCLIYIVQKDKINELLRHLSSPFEITGCKQTSQTRVTEVRGCSLRASCLLFSYDFNINDPLNTILDDL